jgi:hypothetical protein
MDPSGIRDAISRLTQKEILVRMKGVLTIPYYANRRKDLLLDYVLEKAPHDQLDFLQKAGQAKYEAKNGAPSVVGGTARKRKRAESLSTRRTAQRLDDGDEIESDSSNFLHLPTPQEVKSCYCEFYEATSNDDLVMYICGVCARECSKFDNKASPHTMRVDSLPNGHRLIPKTSHPAHDLFDGKLLEPEGVDGVGGAAMVTVCSECWGDLRKGKDQPPSHALANNMWIGKVPWQLQVLTFPEQLLLALLYPRVFVFKLYPKKIGGQQNAATLQRGMRGNVSTYELDMGGIASMVEGKMMPRPPAVLASVISVTFVGLGELPKGWLHTTFRVRRQFVFEALRWLKENNPKYYGDVEIDTNRIEALPIDEVPPEILGVVRQSMDAGMIDQESDGYVPVDDEGGTHYSNLIRPDLVLNILLEQDPAPSSTSHSRNENHNGGEIATPVTHLSTTY